MFFARKANISHDIKEKEIRVPVHSGNHSVDNV
ncbi:hypothetical protein PC116_g31888 [Phytophthora cactorum]|nr:hypothetical protein PC116_g31888 [Phytophthora cactorum]